MSAIVLEHRRPVSGPGSRTFVRGGLTLATLAALIAESVDKGYWPQTADKWQRAALAVQSDAEAFGLSDARQSSLRRLVGVLLRKRQQEAERELAAAGGIEVDGRDG